MKKSIGIRKAWIIGICMILAAGLVTLTGCSAKGFPYSEYQLDDYIKVGKYKGLTVEREAVTITKEEVQAAIDNALSAAAEDGKTPEYNDAFAKTQGDYKNTEEYEKALKKKLYIQKQEQAVYDQKMALWDKVVTKSEVKDYPMDEVDLYKKSNSEQMDILAKEYDVSREKILSKYGFSDEEAFEVSNDESSKLRVKQELIVAKIAENEGLSYTDEEKEEMIGQLEAQGYTNKTVKEQTGRSMDQYVCIQLLYDKVLDLILDKAKVK